MVWAVSLTIFPALFLNWLSNLDPRVLSLTIIAESTSSSKSDVENFRPGSTSETPLILSTMLLFIVFGFRLYNFSNGDFPSAFTPVLDAYKISDNPDLSFSVLCSYSSVGVHFWFVLFFPFCHFPGDRALGRLRDLFGSFGKMF